MCQVNDRLKACQFKQTRLRLLQVKPLASKLKTKSCFWPSEVKGHKGLYNFQDHFHDFLDRIHDITQGFYRTVYSHLASFVFQLCSHVLRLLYIFTLTFPHGSQTPPSYPPQKCGKLKVVESFVIKVRDSCMFFISSLAHHSTSSLCRWILDFMLGVALNILFRCGQRFI